MRKSRWLFPVLLSSTYLVGCGKFRMEGSKKSIDKACAMSHSEGVRMALDRTSDQSYNHIEPNSLPFTKCIDLYAYIDKQRNKYQSCKDQGEPKVVTAYADNNVVYAESSQAPAVMTSQKGAQSPDIITNLRERGVDEADLAKVSKSHIFVASAGQIAVLDRKSKQWIGHLKVDDSHFKSSIEPLAMAIGPKPGPQILTKDEKLLVVTASKIQVYSLKPMSMPVLKDEVALSQPASEVRLMGSRLIVLSHNYSYGISNGRPIEDDLMIRSLPCNATYAEMFPNRYSNQLSATVVKSIDIDNLKNEKSFAFLQKLDSYITTNNIYLYSQDYSRDTTYIRKVSITEKGDLLEVATGSVPGFIKDSWALSESGKQAEFLSVVSTSQTKRSSQLSILTSKESKLTMVGSVGDFGIDEDVKSVRKIENIVFVVTFREVDPLFAIDISDVKSPTILSSLKIPGFSSYMHPFGSNRLIGLGYSGANRGFDRSVQLSLFDTTEMTDVKRIDAISIGGSRSNSIATYDYHAFFMDQENSIVGFPIEYSSEVSKSTSGRAEGASDSLSDQAGPDKPQSSNDLTSGAALYKIGLTSIKAFKFIQHDDIAIASSPRGRSVATYCHPFYSPSRILRLLKIDNQLVSISENALKTFDITEDMPLVASVSWENEQTFCSPMKYD